MSVASREREQKRRPGTPMFKQEKQAREEFKKAKEGSDTIEVNPQGGDTVSPGTLVG